MSARFFWNEGNTSGHRTVPQIGTRAEGMGWCETGPFPSVFKETSELLSQRLFKLLEARRPEETVGVSGCCNKGLHHRAFDFSSSET